MKGKEMNKYQEALEKIGDTELYKMPEPDEDGFIDHSHVELIRYQEFNTIKKLVDKTIPLKPLHKSVLKQFGRCGKCNAPIDIRNHMRFCGNCGQAIDWTNETE